MTYGNNYALAEKMKDRFSRRGSDVSGMQASTTSELMRMAEREHNPNGNAAEAAFRRNYSRRTGAPVHTAAQSDAPRRQAPRKSAPAGKRGDAHPGMKSRTQTGRAPGTKTSPAPEAKIVRPEPIIPSAEVHAERKPFPMLFFVFLICGALIFMALVMGMSENYKTNREIDMLERQLAQLEETAEQLELRLEDKNDVKKIETLASERLGMVKEEYVQKEYISLSDGERIELIDSGEEESSGGIMLSSIFSALGDFFERFK